MMRNLTAVCTVLAVIVAGGCSVARDTDQPAPSTAAEPVPTAIAPPAAPGLTGVAGLPPPNACTTIAGPVLSAELGQGVTARPRSWNDAGLPSLDLCTLVLPDREVRVGITALPAQKAAIERLGKALGGDQEGLPELSADARTGPLGVVFTAADRAISITSDQGLDRAQSLAIGRAVQAVADEVAKVARESDSVCQPSGAPAEQFLGVQAQLRRDYRTENGGLTCIWGSVDATVAIVESIRQDTIPEADREPKPRLAPVGDEGYYLPEEGELVFRRGRRVVRVTALSDPSRPATLDRLFEIVEPIMPLFIR
jgi:hypothetical protein